MIFISMVFSQKNLPQGKWAILGPKMILGHNSGSTVRILFTFLTNKEAESIIENCVNCFSEKLFIY